MIEEFISHVVVQGKASPGSVTPIESALSFDSSRANVKTHKALLLERVTEPRRYAPGTRLGGHSEKEWF